MSRSTSFVVIVVAALMGFLAGSLWQYSWVRSVRADLQDCQSRSSQIQDELQSCSFERSLGGLRDMAGQIYLETQRGNFDVAASYSTVFFDRVDQIRQEIDSGDLRSVLGEISNGRDSLTAQLARLEPAARGTIEEIYSSLYSATVQEEIVTTQQ